MHNNFYFNGGADFFSGRHLRHEQHREFPHPGFGGGRGRGGRARRGDLRKVILILLADKPMHGYEIITTIAERTEQRWEPSAGAIYPQLSQLEDEGLIRTEPVDGKKVAHLTDEGRVAAEEFTAEREQLWQAYSQPWEGGPGEHGHRGPQGRPGPSPIIEEARRFFGIASDPVDWRSAFERLFKAVSAVDESRRDEVVAILDRAAKDVEKLS